MANLANISTNEEQYRQQWATKTGRPESDIYIPEALRETGNGKSAEGSADSENRGA
jgi:hypothetical protein